MKVYPSKLKEFNYGDLQILICLTYYNGDLDGFVTYNEEIYYYCLVDFCEEDYRNFRKLSNNIDVSKRWIYGLFSIKNVDLSLPLLKALCEERGDNADYYKSYFEDEYDLNPSIFSESSLIGWTEL